MFRYYFFALILLLVFNSARAQTDLTGSVTDENHTALPGATVLLRQGKDSMVVYSTVSDSTGSFLFKQVKKGHYLLEVSYVTYTSFYQQLSAPAEPLYIVLAPTGQNLKNVTVKGRKRKPTITVNAGKVNVNVESSPLLQSKSAYELVKNLPGVTITKDGEIKLKGKAGVTVMIDGEPVELGNAQLKNLLKSTPGNAIANVEVMNTPPSSMEASGNGGVINIVFKRKVQRGFNGSVTSGLGIGHYVKTDHGFTLSHGSEKWNINASYTFDLAKTWQRDSSFRPVGADAAQRIEQVQLNPEKSLSHFAKLAIDRYLGDKNTLSLTLSYNGVTSPYTGNTATRFYGKGALPDSSLLQQNNMRGKNTDWEGTLKFKRKIDDTRSFSTLFQLNRTEINDLEDFGILAAGASGNPIRPFFRYRNLYPGTVNHYSLRADYTQDIMLQNQKAGKLEMGVKSSLADIHYHQRTEDLQNGSWQPDAKRGNRFHYREGVHAAYASADLNVRKWELRGGLRLEYTDIKGDSASGSPLLVKQQYASLFPNVQAGYHFHKYYKLYLSYSRRIERPDYDKLNPAARYLDLYTIETGNPYLKPQFSDNIELGQQFFSFIDLTATYSQVKDPLYFSFIQDANGPQAKYTTINAGRQHQLNVSLSFPIPGINRWENFQTVYFYTSSFNAVIDNQSYHESAATFGASTYNSIKLGGGVSLELNGWYEGGGLYGNFRYKPMGEASLGISKKFFADKLHASISFNDMFYTDRFRSLTINKGGVNGYTDSRTDSRMVKLSLSFHFGKKPGKPKDKEENDEEEKSRTPGGKEGKFFKPGKQ